MKIIACLLFSCVLTTGCACEGKGERMKKLAEGQYIMTEKGEVKSVNKLTFDYIGGSDVMPIGGYWGPYSSGGSINGYVFPDLISDEIYGALSEAGINMIVRSADNASYADSAVAEKGLALADKYNIGIFVPTDEMDSLAGPNTQYKDGRELPFSLNEFKELTGRLSKYNSFLGYSVTDEPTWTRLDGFGRAFGLFEEIGMSGTYNMYANVLPYLSGKGGFGGGPEIDAEDYFNRIYRDYNIPILSSTGYFYTQQDTPDNMLSKLFTSLSSLRACAIKYNVPFWRMLQAGGQWKDAQIDMESVPVYPSEGELLFDVNIALAYGCKAIQYFPLVQPHYFAYAPNGTFDFNRNGIISAAGKKTQWYYYVQKANKQIKAIDHVLMNATSEGLIAHGDKARSLSHSYDESRTEFFKEEKYRQLTSVSGDDCFIGCFDYKGGTALYVVNYSRTEKAKVNLSFRDNYGYEIYQRALLAEVMGKKVELTLENGEGVLIVLK